MVATLASARLRPQKSTLWIGVAIAASAFGVTYALNAIASDATWAWVLGLGVTSYVAGAIGGSLFHRRGCGETATYFVPPLATVCGYLAFASVFSIPEAIESERLRWAMLNADSVPAPEFLSGGFHAPSAVAIEVATSVAKSVPLFLIACIGAIRGRRRSACA